MKPTRPEQRPLAPIPEAKPEPNEVLSVAFGKTTSGLHCVALLSIRDLDTHRIKVHRAEVLLASRNAASVEEEWAKIAYLSLFHGTPPAADEKSRAHVFASGGAVALPKAPPSRRVAVALEVDGNTVTSKSIIFEGAKMDAWLEANDWASRNLLLESAAQRRRAAQ